MNDKLTPDQQKVWDRIANHEILHTVNRTIHNGQDIEHRLYVCGESIRDVVSVDGIILREGIDYLIMMMEDTLDYYVNILDPIRCIFVVRTLDERINRRRSKSLG